MSRWLWVPALLGVLAWLAQCEAHLVKSGQGLSPPEEKIRSVGEQPDDPYKAVYAAILNLAARREEEESRNNIPDFVPEEGQPEDIGYGYQRVRNPKPLAAAYDPYKHFVIQDDGSYKYMPDPDAVVAAATAFRERFAKNVDDWKTQLESGRASTRSPEGGAESTDYDYEEDDDASARARRQRQHQQKQASLHGATLPEEDLSERTLPYLREAWGRFQQRAGNIDVPDDLTDQEAIQLLESLDNDNPESDRSKRPIPGPGPGPGAPYVRAVRSPASAWNYYNSPLAWSGYQLRKRSHTPGHMEVADGVSRARLAMLLGPVFDERYEDPAKRLLLSKRSLPQGVPLPEPLPQALPLHLLRRKKSAEHPEAPVTPPRNDPQVQQDLAELFGEPEPPRALPLAAGPDPHEDKKKNASSPSVHAPVSPIGHAHESDRQAHDHAHGLDDEWPDHAHETPEQHAKHTKHSHDKGTTTEKPIEHAPPMVSAEGPHGHDEAVHAEDKKKTKKTSKQEEGETVSEMQGEQEPRAMELRRIAKKSVTWSDYFGIDRRRKKSATLGDFSTNRVDDSWLLRQYLQAFLNASREEEKSARSVDKRVAVKKEGAPPDALLLWEGWEDAGRCAAVTRLTEDCRSAVGPKDKLLPLCVVFQTCHLCGAAVGISAGRSCDMELARIGSELCQGQGDEADPGKGSDEESLGSCRAALERVVALQRARHADSDTCTRHPCLARFFLASPTVGYAQHGEGAPY